MKPQMNTARHSRNQTDLLSLFFASFAFLRLMRSAKIRGGFDGHELTRTKFSTASERVNGGMKKCLTLLLIALKFRRALLGFASVPFRNESCGFLCRSTLVPPGWCIASACDGLRAWPAPGSLPGED